MTVTAVVVLVVAAWACWGLWRRLPAPAAPVGGVAPSPIPAQALRIDRLVASGIAHAGDVHQQLRPLLAEAIEPALARRGLALGDAEAPLRALLGDELWELVRPNRPRPQDPWAPGLKRRDLARIIDRLEEL